MTQVSVLIPTFRRPESFRRAAQSVFAQTGVTDIELIAIDNSPEASARAVFAELAAAAAISFRFAHEPRSGVANARNAALALAQGRYVAWLDDDEEATPEWLAALLAVRNATGAQSVFGPVHARAEENSRWRGFIEGLYTRKGATDHAETPAYGIGNSLQPRALFDSHEFDPRANESGGEDDRLFASWSAAGARYAWAANAIVTEHVEGDRARFSFALKRAFAYGQGPCETAWRQRHIATLARHMIVGGAQFCVFGVGAAIAAIAHRARALAYLDRATRGAGKVFWFFQQRFYGAKLADA